MNSGHHWFRLGLIVLAALMASNVVGQSETPEEAVDPRPTAPEVLIAMVPGYDDEVAYRRSMALRVKELARLAELTQEPLAHADLLSAAANRVLAHGLEPACTRAVLGIDDCEDADDREARLRATLDKADEILADAESALNKAQEGEAASADRRRESQHHLEMLQAFGQALREYLLPGDSAAGRSTARQAASRLSGLLEHRDPQVAAAARMWQAHLRTRNEDPRRALSVLHLALADPSPEGLRHAFFARLLRCRIIAGRGGFATALALLIQLEERCPEWFVSEADRRDALRATTLVEIEVLGDWHDHLEPTTHPAERTWCAERIKTLKEQRFPEDNRTVLRLTPAIPIIIRAAGAD